MFQKNVGLLKIVHALSPYLLFSRTAPLCPRRRPRWPDAHDASLISLSAHGPKQTPSHISIILGSEVLKVILGSEVLEGHRGDPVAWAQVIKATKATS